MSTSTVDRPAATVSANPDSPPGQGNSRFEQIISNLRHDVPASLVVFLVALPLSLGIAIASGAPIMAGLIAAIIGGVVAGALGGSILQVSGPAAGLTVVVAELINTLGWEVTCVVTAGAGMLQVLFGLSRIARAALAIAPVVVHAMLGGIGITIALQQVHVLLGGTSASSAVSNLTSLPGTIADMNVQAFLVGGTVIAILLGWRFVPERFRKIPGPLVGIVVATAISLIFPLEVERIVLNGSLFDAIGLPAMPKGEWQAIVTGMLTVALIASVESLLSAVAVDKMHTGTRANFDRELIGQGSANIVSGLAGGLPVTGVIVRSATNVAAGARSRASGILHGFWILLFSAVLASVVQQIPKAALAGLLIIVGIQLVKLAHIKMAKRTGDLIVYGVTVFFVVVENLLEGVLIGLAVAFAMLMWRVLEANIHATETAHGRWLVTIDGTLSFLALPKLTKALAAVPEGAQATVEMAVDFVDHATYDAITSWAGQHQNTGGTVRFVELGSARMDAAVQGPPARGAARSHLDELLGSWNGATDSESEERKPALQSIFAGVSTYHRRHAPVMRPHLDGLRDNQDPDTLFLTCADSRVVPNVITGSGPGDLFTIRNVGNLVPSKPKDPSVEAALSFGIEELAVSSVVVCGHSGCGAMHALLDGHNSGDRGDGAVSEWLRNADPSLQNYLSGHAVAVAAAAAGFSEVDQLSMVNIATQVENLNWHPLVQSASANGDLQVAGMFFDIGSARVIQVTATDIIELDEHAPVR